MKHLTQLIIGSSFLLTISLWLGLGGTWYAGDWLFIAGFVGLVIAVNWWAYGFVRPALQRWMRLT